MVKKKKPAVKKAAKRKVATQKLRTKFMSAFIAEFISSTTDPWPDPTQAGPSVIADFDMFMDVLLKACVLQQPPVPDGSGSLRDRLANFLLAQNWPVLASIPKLWQGIQPTVRLIEVSVIADALLKAINAWRGGSGGGPNQWPPH
jgi:hypothetical protein